MKTKLEQISINNHLQFPCIAKFINYPGSYFLALFTDYTTGTVIHTTNPKLQPLGAYSTDWVHLSDEECWEIVDSVTINFSSDV